MNLSSMYNQTFQPTEMGFFSKGNFLEAAVKSLSERNQDEGMYNDHWSLVDSQCHLVVA